MRGSIDYGFGADIDDKPGEEPAEDGIDASLCRGRWRSWNRDVKWLFLVVLGVMKVRRSWGFERGRCH